MNWDPIQANWKPLKGKAKQMWGDLTDQKIDVIEGKREELVNRLHEVWAHQKAGQRASRWLGKKPCKPCQCAGTTQIGCDSAC